jgi:hypothetical protein
MGKVVVVENDAGHAQKQVNCEEEQIFLAKRFYPIPKTLTSLYKTGSLLLQVNRGKILSGTASFSFSLSDLCRHLAS